MMTPQPPKTPTQMRREAEQVPLRASHCEHSLTFAGARAPGNSYETDKADTPPPGGSKHAGGTSRGRGT